MCGIRCDATYTLLMPLSVYILDVNINISLHAQYFFIFSVRCVHRLLAKPAPAHLKKGKNIMIHLMANDNLNLAITTS